MNNKYQIQIGDQKAKLEINKLAKQTNASCLITLGETSVLVTAVMSAKPNESINYFPLSVEYEEHYFASGKIRGSRFMKRKGRPTDDAILSGRLIDRGIRPLFPKGMKNDVQVVVNVLSFDFKTDPRALAFIATGIALEASDIPFDGPFSGAVIGENEGKLIVNPTIQEQEKSKLNLFIGGIEENVSMIEADAKEAKREMIVEGVKLAQEENKKLAAQILKIIKQEKKEKKEVPLFLIPQELKKEIKEKYQAKLEEFFENYQDKKSYEKLIDELAKQLESDYEEAISDETKEEITKENVKEALFEANKKLIQTKILKEEKRLGGRTMDEVRSINSEVSTLPRTHGSAVFERGETQGLTLATLGAPGSELLLDGMADEPEAIQRYMHFYSFPPYSVGETGFMRGPGRREIGHGALGEKSLMPVIPSKEDFPYTIIMNTEIMASDGSTSMASACGSTLALMDAGVPIKAPVSGVAMGLIVDESDIKNYKILTDLCANEDFSGHMDFKVAGTPEGITALQMDIKVKGITIEIIEDALVKADEGRAKILAEMLKTIPEPNKELSKYAPRIEKLTIDPDKIRELIGPGGKMINSIIEKTGVQIDIEDDGTVYVASCDKESMDEGIKLIKAVVKVPKAGEVYVGKVTRIMTFGAFAEFLPGQEGLIHISKLNTGERVNQVSDVLSVGEKVKVKIEEVDNLGRYNLSLIEKIKA